ncbi:MAG: ATP-binding protein [Chloroflexota bacterium]|nr:MAG: histidine kinase [Bellilinea sp.]
MRELSLHLLDIAENSISAGAKNITITIHEDTAADRLYLSVQDDGKGMDEEMVKKVTDPFVTTRTTRKVGLGIPLLKAAAEACNGWLRIQSRPGEGTLVEVEFQRSHIDRMPLGDVAGTFLTLLVGNPQIHWVFHYSVDRETFELDDQQIKQELQDIPLSDPLVLSYLRELLENTIHSLQTTSVH